MDIAAVEVSENLTDVSATHHVDGLKDAEKAATIFRQGVGKFKEMFKR